MKSQSVAFIKFSVGNATCSKVDGTLTCMCRISRMLYMLINSCPRSFLNAATAYVTIQLIVDFHVSTSLGYFKHVAGHCTFQISISFLQYILSQLSKCCHSKSVHYQNFLSAITDTQFSFFTALLESFLPGMF